MRNLQKYPITKEEILRTLEESKWYFHDKELIGDIRPIALIEAMKVVEEYYDPV